ncbi:MAG TPA: N-acetylmuramoyl-L-alanine amidase [Dissulfurispiraceae bacterium]|nr:N-acetylmuramoyl-L-alanine amidase [Dissulfurispiraceae bacterium]
MVTPYRNLSPIRLGFAYTVSLISLALQLFLMAGVVRAFAADNASAVSGDQAVHASAATLRVGKHARYFRLVFDTAESYVQKASVKLSGANAIKIDFQSPVSFSVPGRDAPKTFVNMGTVVSKNASYELDKGLKITAGINGCIITVDNLENINVIKLSLPSRLVIDAYISRERGGSVANGVPGVSLTAPDAAELKVESFVIDAGHGGYESGVRFEKTVEKELALFMAKELAGVLAGKGEKVALTRKGDQMVSLKDRIGIVNNKSPDLLISIHVSSQNEFVVYTAGGSYTKAAGGIETDSEKSAILDRSEAVAQAIARSTRNSLKVNVRIEKMPLSLLSGVHVPSVLIELPSPDKFSYDVKSRRLMIDSIWVGIMNSTAGGLQA